MSLLKKVTILVYCNNNKRKKLDNSNKQNVLLHCTISGAVLSEVASLSDKTKTGRCVTPCTSTPNFILFLKFNFFNP